MAVKRKLIPWTSKPPLGAPLNTSHPLAAGLLLSCLLNEQSGSKVYDGVQGKEFSINGAGWEGGAFSLRLATGSISLSGLPCQINSTNRWSLVVRAKGAPYASTVAPIISANFDAAVNYWALVKQQYTSQLYLRGRFNNYGDFAGGAFLPAGFFEQDAVETIVLTINGYVATIYREDGSVSSVTLGASSDVTATGIVVGNTANANYRGAIDSVQFYGRTLTADEARAIINNPWQLSQPRIRRISTGVAGPTTYTEPLTALAESYASVTSIATMIDAGEAIIEAGVSATATIQMLEGLLTTAESASVATAIVQRVEALLATIQAVDSVQTAAALVEALIATASSDAAVADTLTTAGAEAVTTAVEAVVTVADVAQYQAQLLAAAGVTTAVADTVGAAEAPQTSATAEASVQDIVQMLEQVYTAATAQVAVTDSVVTGIAESLLTSATAITSATDVQLMVDNITIMVASHASIGEIHGYLEQLATAATSGASVTDVLVTAFVGAYIFRDFCTPRRFHDLCTPRSFHDLCTPRGAA